MSPSASLSDFLGAYRLHLSGYDWFILTLGGLLLLLQTALSLWARAVLVRPPDALPFLRQMSLKLFDRLCASVIEVFTLLGLLGTVFSLLYTFTRADTGDPNDVLRAFAPAFTATISGLLCAISNKLLYDTAFSPLLEELLTLFPGPAPTPSVTTSAPTPPATQTSTKDRAPTLPATQTSAATTARAAQATQPSPPTTPDTAPPSEKSLTTTDSTAAASETSPTTSATPEQASEKSPAPTTETAATNEEGSGATRAAQGSQKSPAPTPETAQDSQKSPAPTSETATTSQKSPTTATETTQSHEKSATEPH